MGVQVTDYWKIPQLLLEMILLQVQQFRKTDRWELHGSDLISLCIPSLKKKKKKYFDAEQHIVL